MKESLRLDLDTHFFKHHHGHFIELMIFDGRSEEPIVRYGFEQVFQKIEEPVTNRVGVFGLKIVYIRLVLIRQPRFTTAEEIVDLQILSQKLLGKELVVTAIYDRPAW